MSPIGKRCEPFKSGNGNPGLFGWPCLERIPGREKKHLWRYPLPAGLKENDPPSGAHHHPYHQADQGHDEDISREAILSQGLVHEDDYAPFGKIYPCPF